jgi:hypothetical protein
LEVRGVAASGIAGNKTRFCCWRISGDGERSVVLGGRGPADRAGLSAIAVAGRESQSGQLGSVGAAPGSHALPTTLGPQSASFTSAGAPSTALPADATQPTLPAGAKRRAADAYAKLPLAFIPNAGQTDHSVRYYAQGAGYSFYFTNHKAVLALQRGRRGEALDLRYLGANPNAELTAADRASGRVNYLTASEHHTDLPTYRRLIYRNLWPGIDMVFGGKGGKLNYEFLLRRGAKVSDIRLAYAGADGVSLGAGGGLLVKTPLGTLRDARPQSFQLIDGRRVPVDSHYSLAGDSYGFSVGHHDRGQPLVIDPSLAYSTFLGGSAFDFGAGIAVDSAGAAYVTGTTISTDFPTTAGAFDTSLDGFRDAFVTKLNPAGSGLAYSTFLGGSAPFDPRAGGAGEFGEGIAVDSTGAAYVTGTTRSADFPTTAGAFDTSLDGFRDAFVAKLAFDPPASTPQCKVTGGGQVTAGNGDAATFSGSAQSDAAGSAKGQEQYQDLGPTQPQSVKSIRILALTCNQARTQATIFGEATINGTGSHQFQIEVQDLGEPGRGSDTYRILLDTGYDSGVHTLAGGNVQIHKG